MPSLIAKRYAQALFNSANESGELKTVRADIAIVMQAIRDSEDFQQFLKNPVIFAQNRRKILSEIFHKKIHPVTENFLFFLSSKGRLVFLKEISEIFEDLYCASQSILKVKFTSSFPLEHQEIGRISERLSEKFKKVVEPQMSIDKSVIGGFKLQVEDMVYDFSVKTQLENFKKRVIHQQKATV